MPLNLIVYGLNDTLMSNHIQFSVNENGTAFITLDRPEKKDALDLEMQIALTKIFQKIKTDPAVKQVVLDSGWDDHAFCAGMDVEDLYSVMTFELPDKERLESNQGVSECFARMLDAVASCGKPIIGIVDGPAIGAGATLVCLCDYVVASDNAAFAYPEVRMGMKPSVSAPYVVARIGRENAIRHFSSGERFYVTEAERMGMVNSHCRSENLKETVERIVVAA